MASNNLFESVKIKPKMIVFDLDSTLWPFECDIYVGDKLEMKDGVIYDSSGYVVDVFNDSQDILEAIKAEEGVLLACASRTPTPHVAKKLLELRGWDKLFDIMEIYPSSKIQHFNNLHKKTGIYYDEMVFFDDLSWNITDAVRLGVHAHLVPNGISIGSFKRALKKYEQDKLKSSNNC